MKLITQLSKGKVEHPLKDIIAGVIVALVSLPIGLGYAQIAGLPAVYGLYGSFLPILIYAFMTTSPQFVVGVDAMPAAMVGGLLSEFMIAPESGEALSLVPIISFLVAVWFVIFYFIKAGRIIKYISKPVLSGFISGVGITIIMMQIPKLFGGAPGTGEVIGLTANIINQLEAVNPVSLLLAMGTIIIILVCKKLVPKLPMTVIMIGVGALLQIYFKVSEYGVRLLPEVASGLPGLFVPDFSVMSGRVPAILMESFSIAAVVMAQTLLATGSYAQKYRDEIDAGSELLAYAGMNVAGGIVGCCPINGSVSRSGIADSFGARSQLMSIAAGLSMLFILLFGTPVLQYLPVPVLTGIVMTALIGILDFKMFFRLWKTTRGEWLIFMVSLAAVLFLGTVNGVIVGCLLSFWEVAVKAAQPPVCFVGRIPGHGNFHSLERNSHAHPIKNVVIYRFNGNLFFANIDRMEGDIEAAIKEDTRVVVIDARGIGSIDITAVDRLVLFEKKLSDRGIRLYITEHESSLNDQIRSLGGESLLDDGIIRRTITLALRDAGYHKPYELEGAENEADCDFTVSEEKLAEFEWAFGDEAEERLRRLAESTVEELTDHITGHDEHIELLENREASTKWGILGRMDEMEFWDFIEQRIERLSEKGVFSSEDVGWIEKKIEERRQLGEDRLNRMNPRALKLIKKRREKILQHIQERKNQKNKSDNG